MAKLAWTREMPLGTGFDSFSPQGVPSPRRTDLASALRTLPTERLRIGAARLGNGSRICALGRVDRTAGLSLANGLPRVCGTAWPSATERYGSARLGKPSTVTRAVT